MERDGTTAAGRAAVTPPTKYVVSVTNQIGYNELKEFATIGDAVCWLDKVLSAVRGFSLMTELNDLQADCMDGLGESALPDKFGMPLRIYNYIISKYNLEITQAK